MRPQTGALGALTALTMMLPTVAAAYEPGAPTVDLALVLLTDVSNSMDNHEFELVKEGYRAAFSDPQVVAAILDNSNGVAVAYVEFSSQDNFMVVRGWDVLKGPDSARTFGNAVASAPRSSFGNTALAVSIRKAADMLSADRFSAARRVIDVASDHPNDYGRSAPVRDAAVAAGITINALPFIDDRPIGTFDGRLNYTSARWGLESTAEFYRHDVIGGPGSFLVEVHDLQVFAEALKRKLLRELISLRPDAMSETVATASAE